MNSVTVVRATAVGLLVVLAACGASEPGGQSQAEAGPVMPDVVSQRLDNALDIIKNAGFDDEVDIVGGGTFGVIDESNWQVCEQSPPAGGVFANGVELTVDRSCGDDETETTTPPAESEPLRTEPSPVTSIAITEPAPTTPEATEPQASQPLTAATNQDLAALLLDPAECGPTVEQFASTYRGVSIEFDGYVAAVGPHDESGVRLDFLIRAGDSNELSGPGPNFTFRDVSLADLDFDGSDPQVSIGPMANVHVLAQVVLFERSSCLLLLAPVSVLIR